MTDQTRNASYLSEMSLSEIKEHVLDLNREIEYLRETSKFGIVLKLWEVGFIEAVFDKDPRKAVAHVSEMAYRQMQDLVAMRYQTAVSGAMRWEFSQEARISIDSETGEYVYN
jgi:hypothetical protein